MENKSGLLVVISGPSGVGKNTIIEELLRRNPDKYVYSISATTRTLRGDERDGVNYFFMSREEFEQKIKNDEFIEFAQYQQNYYGTPKFYIEENLNQGRIILLDIDVQGALKIMHTKLPVYFIFIAPESLEILHERLTKRSTESEARIQARIEAARAEIQQAEKFDKIVINNELMSAIAEIENLIKLKLERL